jgi:hypothetical protein
MKTIEFIKVRTGNSNSFKNLEALQQIASDAIVNAPAGTIKFYRHVSVIGDFAYLLCWDRETFETEGSPLGIKIRKSLESLGVVDYAAWTSSE